MTHSGRSSSLIYVNTRAAIKKHTTTSWFLRKVRITVSFSILNFKANQTFERTHDTARPSSRSSANPADQCALALIFVFILALVDLGLTASTDTVQAT
jgi:hypothetical protein